MTAVAKLTKNLNIFALRNENEIAGFRLDHDNEHGMSKRSMLFYKCQVSILTI